MTSASSVGKWSGTADVSIDGDHDLVGFGGVNFFVAGPPVGEPTGRGDPVRLSSAAAAAVPVVTAAVEGWTLAVGGVGVEGVFLAG